MLRAAAKLVGYILFGVGVMGTILRFVISCLDVGYGAEGFEIQLMSLTSACILNLVAGYMLIQMSEK